MGIKHFFYWLCQKHPEILQNVSKQTPLPTVDVHIDSLMLDMNGIYHACAQKVYEYGNGAPKVAQHSAIGGGGGRGRLLKPTNARAPPPPTKLTGPEGQRRLFESVGQTIEHLFTLVAPKKSMVLCVDGVAPLSKQNQQRQRRFRSTAASATPLEFDSNCITPGTKFMHDLSDYIQWFIHNKLTTDTRWHNVDIVFSNERVPGEGEHKLVNYIRKYGRDEETFCIYGNDADLIMLSLATHRPRFYILREDMYNPANDYFCVNVSKMREVVVDMMYWTPSSPLGAGGFSYDPRSAINDFVFLCFAVGNDFLPHIPSIEIIHQGLELLIEVYKDICSTRGHFTRYKQSLPSSPGSDSDVDTQGTEDDIAPGDLRYANPLTQPPQLEYDIESMETFFRVIGTYEKVNYEHKLAYRGPMFPDPTLLRFAKRVDRDRWNVDITGYLDAYCAESFGPGADMQRVCHEYYRGLQWVLSYYTSGIPTWTWLYEHHYAPPASVLGQHGASYRHPAFVIGRPNTPFQQLLSVLPPKSAHLIPAPLCTLLTDVRSPLRAYCPETVPIDVRGKRKEWEALVLVCYMDQPTMRKEYDKLVGKVHASDAVRNCFDASRLYRHSTEEAFTYKCSRYGDILSCSVDEYLIEL